MRIRYTRHIFLLLLAVMPTLAFAQQDPYFIYGRVIQNFTKEFMPDVKVEVMTPDSTVIRTRKTSKKLALSGGEEYNVAFIGEEELPYKSLILRFTHEGFLTEYQNIELETKKGERYWIFKDVVLKKDPYYLKAATVTQTLVKMVMKGDTIVYNADAFQLSQGSMLDALISSLPGVELHDGGRITVNGRFVSSLLVNGEDFFRGDPKVALDNLPAYMVDKVKVYEKEAEYAYITEKDRKDTKELPLVVDVNLKRQYAIGWVANAEAGYGSHDRFLGRVFGLRFTKQSRIALFGNLNNTNDTREPGLSGDWTSAGGATGRTTSKTGGMELLVNDKNRHWKINSNMKVKIDNIDNLQKVSVTSNLPGNDNYSRQSNRMENKRINVTSDHRVEIKLPKLYLAITPQMKYTYNKHRWHSRQAEFLQRPAEAYRLAALDSIYMNTASPQLLATLINRHSADSKGWTRTWMAGGAMQGYYNMPLSDDFVEMNIGGRYDSRKNGTFSHDDLRFGQQDAKEDIFQNRYFTTPETNWNINASLSYCHKMKWGLIKPTYSFRRTHNSSERGLYRLEDYDEWNNPEMPLGKLPSTTDSIQQVIDSQNSYTSVSDMTLHRLGTDFTVYLFRKKHSLSLIPGIRFERDRLNYRRAAIDTVATRHICVFEPSVRYGANNFSLTYSYGTAAPAIVNTLLIRDDANPLFIRTGNPHLKNSHYHTINLYRSIQQKEKHTRTMEIRANYTLTEQAVVYAMSYMPTTGVRYYRPENINGNWYANGSFGLTQAIDGKRNLHFSTKSGVQYNNNVDLIAIGDATSSTRSSVRNLKLNENLSLDYRIKQIRIKGKAGVDWMYARSERTDFQTISSTDFNYGIEAQIGLPWDIHLSTDITMFSRRGYDDASMNDDNLVWNARLSKSMLNGNLTFAIDGFDILRQLSNIRRTVNGQGFTETWYNTMPSYVMAHIVYRLNKQPKKK